MSSNQSRECRGDRLTSANSTPGRGSRGGLTISRRLSRTGISPYDEVAWEKRKACIVDEQGRPVFEQENVEVPKSWSMLATNVVASKYFHGGQRGRPREHSVRQLVHRVVRTLTDWGRSDGYFASDEDTEAFYDELSAVCLRQYGTFNSPVWFNVGLYHVYGYTAESRSCFAWDEARQRVVPADDGYRFPQCSACFIQSVRDTLEDIMALAASEAMLFKFGSGTGTDLSPLRSRREKLSNGGTPSGPLSFMRIYDQVAAVVKSGGKTRRAAKMQSLRVTHPDILEFIHCKRREEEKAQALIRAGYDGSFGGEAYDSVFFQNSNLSVRVTDEFMRAVENDGTFQTVAVVTGEPMDTLRARDVLRQIAEAAHACGDPGVQYDTTINRWHTCAASGRIHASNPCSEFMFLDDSACNLASINLTALLDETGSLNVELFRHIVRLFIIAQDILVDHAGYPTERIAVHSHAFRPLGLGYANLGALVMRLGYPYDSDEARGIASAITALLTGYAYEASADIARVRGSFAEYAGNRTCMLGVLRMHRDAVQGVITPSGYEGLRQEAERVWDCVLKQGEQGGFRNAQVTLLAPTGTIGFMMDCDTMGIEPDLALVKYKQLAGGGTMKMVNRTVPLALRRLGYSAESVERIVRYIEEQDTIEGAPDLDPRHLPVFDCAFRPRKGVRFIPYTAHLRMMAAVQPFLSGAISKTVNLPQETTVEEVMQLFSEGWKLGLKAVAIYRDGSKGAQPVRASLGPEKGASTAESSGGRPLRRRMPSTRHSITHKFSVGGHEGYLTVGIYEDGTPGELFITMAKEGSTVGGTMDAFGTAISLCLQYGVPLQILCNKFMHSRFEPSGFTGNPQIPMASSIVDYIFRWLAATFPDGRIRNSTPLGPSALQQPSTGTDPAVVPSASPTPSGGELAAVVTSEAPPCEVCGVLTVRNGSCYRCHNCGHSMGCS